MWKRENEGGAPAPSSNPPASGAAPSPAPRAESEPARATASSERAVLSPSIVVRGEVSGDEDLIVEGRIEGKILLRQNTVTIGAKGRVAAEVHARAIQIEGEVDGNLTAEEQIVLRKSSRVRGDLVAPRVTIEDGARFKGSIDMEPKQQRGPARARARTTPDRVRSSRSPPPRRADPLSGSIARRDERPMSAATR